MCGCILYVRDLSCFSIKVSGVLIINKISVLVRPEKRNTILYLSLEIAHHKTFSGQFPHLSVNSCHYPVKFAIMLLSSQIPNSYIHNG